MNCEVDNPATHPRGSSRQNSTVNLAAEYRITYAKMICPWKTFLFLSQSNIPNIARLAAASISCVGTSAVSIGTPVSSCAFSVNLSPIQEDVGLPQQQPAEKHPSLPIACPS